MRIGESNTRVSNEIHCLEKNRPREQLKRKTTRRTVQFAVDVGELRGDLEVRDARHGASLSLLRERTTPVTTVSALRDKTHAKAFV